MNYHIATVLGVTISLGACERIEYIPDNVVCTNKYYSSCIDTTTSNPGAPPPLQTPSIPKQSTNHPTSIEHNITTNERKAKRSDCNEQYERSMTLCRNIVGRIENRQKELEFIATCIEGQGFPNGSAECDAI